MAINFLLTSLQSLKKSPNLKRNLTRKKSFHSNREKIDSETNQSLKEVTTHRSAFQAKMPLAIHEDTSNLARQLAPPRQSMVMEKSTRPI